MNLSNVGVGTFRDVVGTLIGVINGAIPVLVAFALVLFLWSGFRYIYTSGDSHGKAGERTAIIWGLVALFVLLSVWGILRVVCLTFIGNADCQAVSSAYNKAYSPGANNGSSNSSSANSAFPSPIDIRP